MTDTTTQEPLKEILKRHLMPIQGQTLESIERNALLAALELSNGVQRDAAELLGISPRVINYKIKTFGLDADVQALRRKFRAAAVSQPPVAPFSEIGIGSARAQAGFANILGDGGPYEPD